MKKLAMCMLLALAVSCGEDDPVEDKPDQAAALSLTGEIESLRCDGTDAVYVIRMSGNAKLSCTSRPDFATCTGWPEEIVGGRSFEVRCDGESTFRHEMTCRDLRDPAATTVVLYPTPAQEPPGVAGWCS
jgi:hypothetical protein